MALHSPPRSDIAVTPAAEVMEPPAIARKTSGSVAAETVPGARLLYLDNLKWVLIAGVIVSHAATAYGAIGEWAFVEPSLSSLTKAIFSVLTEVGDLFAMGTFMLIAGFLTPTSLARKGYPTFLRDRLLRLGAPVLVTVAVVYPVVVWIIVAVTGYQLTPTTFAQWQLRWLEPGPMWFVAVLLIFSLCYAGWRWVRPTAASQPRNEPLQMRHLLLAAALIAALTFLIRSAFPVGSQQPLEFHLWQWPQLAVLFAIGVLAGERGWLAARPSRLIRRASWVAAPASVIGLFAIVAVSGTDLTSGSGMALYAGGWHWQAALAAGAEGVVAVSGSIAVIDFFRQVGTWHGRLARALGRNSYSAFFLQLPVLVGLELGLMRLPWSGEVKLALTAPAGIVICFALAWAVRQARGAAGGHRRKTTSSQPSLRRGLPHPPVA